jgi:hypothetical protein
VSFRDHDTDAADPFDHDPFGAPPVSAQAAPPHPGPPAAPPGEANTLATLSVVFAFVFAPAGAVLGHLALWQIKRWPQPGHRRAVLGVTLSYVFIVAAVLALIVWLLLSQDRGSDSRVTTAPSAPSASPSVRSTVITPPPPGRPRVSVADLRVGDCVEIQKNQPDPTRPNTDQVYIYRTRCETRDGVFQVRQVGPNANQCPSGEYLSNDQETIFACFGKYGQ